MKFAYIRECCPCKYLKIFIMNAHCVNTAHEINADELMVKLVICFKLTTCIELLHGNISVIVYLCALHHD